MFAMTTNLDETLAALLEDEHTAQLERFGYEEARRLGGWVLERGIRDGLTIAVTVTLGEQRVYSAALPGTSHDNDLWLDRKIAVVGMFAHSSYYVQHLFAQQGRDFRVESRLDPALYAAAGGGFPIRVGGMLVGAIAVSGWNELGEHSLAVEAITALRAEQLA
jgi:uncharacterized protein (UPF0303 family)